MCVCLLSLSGGNVFRAAEMEACHVCSLAFCPKCLPDPIDIAEEVQPDSTRACPCCSVTPVTDASARDGREGGSDGAAVDSGDMEIEVGDCTDAAARPA